MKPALFAALLLAGGAAVAQDPQTSTTTTTTTTGTMEPSGTTGTTGTTSGTTMSTGQTVAPGNTAPERDARGIPVVSDPAQAPPGFNQAPAVGGTGADPSSPPAPQPATENYPVCSRTVTDNCVQSYERGRPR